jgi:Protein of unknown function (DUF1579)
MISCKPLFHVVLVAAAMMLPTAPAFGQDKKDQDKKDQDKKDPQSQFEPRSDAGAGQKFLAKFVGEWNVVKSFFPQSGDPFRVKGVCKQTMINDGKFLQSDFTFGEGKAKTTGVGLIGYETGNGLFTSVWVDSRATSMSMRQSKDKFNGEEIVLYSKSLNDGGKAQRVSRTVTKWDLSGSMLVHRQYNLGQDGSQRLVMELLMTKK